MSKLLIDNSRDDLLTDTGKLMFKDYQKDGETIQETYARVAKNFASNEVDAQTLYDYISTHAVTFASPIMKQAGRTDQYSSCCVSRMSDDSASIRKCISEAAHAGSLGYGLGVDMSSLRACGTRVGDKGYSPGPIGFVKMLEASTVVWTQAGGRPVSACVYFPWYHKDILNLVVLKSNGGTEETRARRLKYAIKVDDVFLERVKNNEQITLVDFPEQFEPLWGEDFRKAYIEYETNADSSLKVNARDVWKAILKERVETGNIYLFHKDNTNKTSMFKEVITQSNLCTEIALPTLLENV